VGGQDQLLAARLRGEARTGVFQSPESVDFELGQIDEVSGQSFDA
jgi:hypothetical protein